MRLRDQIALKPAKTCSTRDFTLRKQYEDITKNSKKIMDFSIFRRPGTVEIQKENPRERCHLAFKCTYSLRQLYFTSSVKFELNPIICERVTNKKVMIFHEICTFEKCIQNLVKYMFFRKSRWKIKSSQNFFAGVRSFQQDTRVQIFTPNGANTQQLQLSMWTHIHTDRQTDTQTDRQTDTHHRYHNTHIYI